MSVMALEQTLALKNTIILYQSPRPITSYPFLTLNPRKTPRRSASMARIKCSFDYSGASYTAATDGNGLYEYERYAPAPASPQCPRPAEIQWKKELCNSVQLIGAIGTPVQIKHLASGKVVAWSRMAVKTSQTATLWINLTFWDELAQVAFQHVEKGHRVYVSGRLVSDTVETDDGKQQTYYKVVVHQLNFIEKDLSSIPLYNGEPNSVAPGKKQNSFAANSTGSTEELWQAFFANPLEWWDNRKNKRSPNYPDFKHKDTGEALWVEGRYNPSWVKSQLDVLDSKMESFHEQNSSTRRNFMSVDSLGQF